MSDDIKHEQPTAGGSWLRQLDGSLVRNEEKPVAKDSKTSPPPKKPKES
jgi:hypothetical protein